MRLNDSLETNVIIEMLKEQAYSQKAKDELGNLQPFLRESECIRKMKETTSARKIIDTLGLPPMISMNDTESLIITAQTGAMLTAENLSSIAKYCIACKRLVQYLKRAEGVCFDIGVYGQSFSDLTLLQNQIERCVNEDRLFDDASSALRDIRRKKERIEGEIKEKLNFVLQNKKQFLSDSFISKRNGHYVVPVLRKFQSQFGGKVIDSSSKGSTVFMEPNFAEALQEKLTEIEIEEDNEIRRILYSLTLMVSDFEMPLKSNIEATSVIDVIFAKGKLSCLLKAREAQISSERRIRIVKGRHPLLKQEECVPLDFSLDKETNGVVITGPNTGGKTVAVKTVGLLSFMALCGLHIPCEEGTVIPMQDRILCDIGDSQNINSNLSTFSGHISNVIDILNCASCDSLVILDELGSGTDPAEGVGIALAVLEELRHRGTMFLVTTHYPQVKEFAEKADEIVAARMSFDRENLKPLYVLEMGKSGESCALHIAKRLGLDETVLERARQEVYHSGAKKYDKYMQPPKTRLVKIPKEFVKKEEIKKEYSMGDSVTVKETGEIGIVFKPADDKGDVVVMIKGIKKKIKHNRIEVKVSASELYPPDYDFSIIFDTVENRKARHTLDRKHDDNAVVNVDPWDN